MSNLKLLNDKCESLNKTMVVKTHLDCHEIQIFDNKTRTLESITMSESVDPKVLEETANDVLSILNINLH